MPTVVSMTLCTVVAGGRILLGLKKKGLGTGLWNGFGGKVEPTETPAIAAARELEEECSLVALDLTQVGHLDFYLPAQPDTVLSVSFFKVSSFSGEPAESDEMAPRWFNHTDIPYHQMWPDDRHWMPMLLAGKCFSGEVRFDESGRIQSHTIAEVPGVAKLP